MGFLSLEALPVIELTVLKIVFTVISLFEVPSFHCPISLSYPFPWHFSHDFPPAFDVVISLLSISWNTWHPRQFIPFKNMGLGVFSTLKPFSPVNKLTCEVWALE